jgi:hypothetical protein
MALPEYLERLNEISIGTLDLTESTQADLKWRGITQVLDCIAFFYTRSQEDDRGIYRVVTGLFRLMFSEVKPALIAAGYWELVLDTQVWRIFREQNYETPPRKVVCWQGRDVDLYELPFEQLGLSDVPAEISQRFESVGDCISYFYMCLTRELSFRLEIEKNKGVDRPAVETLHFDGYLCWVVQPRLAELGCWALIEADVHVRIEDT